MNVKERLAAFISYKGITSEEFERISGLSNSYVHKMRTSIGKLGIMSIQRAFPELNMDWLLRGEGEMLRPTITHQRTGNVTRSLQKKDMGNNDPNAYDTLLRIVEANQRATDRFQCVIEKFQKQIDRMLDLLESSRK